MKKGIILSFISQFLIASCLMPFFFSSVVFADTISGQDAVGTDVSYTAVDSIQYQGTSSGLLVYWNTGTVHIQYKLKKAVIGVVRLQFDIEYFTRENNQWTTSTVTEIVNAKFNGDTFVYEFNLNSFGPLMYTWMDTDNNNVHIDNPLRGWSTTILNSNVTFYDDLTDLQGILDILQDIYSDTSDIVGLSTNQLSELQAILQQCQALCITLTDIDNQLIDVNSELDIIRQLRQYAIPWESYPFVRYFLSRYTPVDFANYYSFQYPFFNVPHNGRLYSVPLTDNPNSFWHTCTFVLISDMPIQNINNLVTNMGIDTSLFTVTKHELIITSSPYLVRFDVTRNENTGNGSLILYNKSGSTYSFCPIYANVAGRTQYVSTDFALQYGLTNQLLDDLHLIAQGTQQSNSASDDLADNTSQFESDRDSYISFEDDMIGDMDDSLNQINLNVGISGFGGYFMNSAVWVRTQFDRLTNNNPYGSLVVYGLTLGIALLFLGKVFL